MKKKILKHIFMFLILLPSMFLFTACGKDSDKGNNNNTPPETPGGSTEQTSSGLYYEDSWDMESESMAYAVSGLGNCTDKDIVIPATYNGKKVVSVGFAAFENANIDSVTLGDNIVELNSGEGEC